MQMKKAIKVPRQKTLRNEPVSLCLTLQYFLVLHGIRFYFLVFTCRLCSLVNLCPSRLGRGCAVPALG